MKINPEALRVIRTRSGWSVSKFATEIGISPSHLSNIEGGRKEPSPEVLEKMWRTLDVPLMALISEYPPEMVA